MDATTQENTTLEGHYTKYNSFSSSLEWFWLDGILAVEFEFTVS